jgi:hypothetical protein
MLQNNAIIPPSSSLLSRQDVINWCYKPFTEFSLINTTNSKLLKVANDQEREWARSVIGGVGNQWTTELCQTLVKESLVLLGMQNVHSTTMKQSTMRHKKYDPDLESDEFVYEVKGRSWTTPGTAGEKILGVPLKYGELPRLYNKPLRIILVGYQEYEARNGYAFGDLLNSNEQTIELRESLDYFSKHQIEYIGFTDILKKIGLYKTE